MLSNLLVSQSPWKFLLHRVIVFLNQDKSLLNYFGGGGRKGKKRRRRRKRRRRKKSEKEKRNRRANIKATAHRHSFYFLLSFSFYNGQIGFELFLLYQGKAHSLSAGLCDQGRWWFRMLSEKSVLCAPCPPGFLKPNVNRFVQVKG